MPGRRHGRGWTAAIALVAVAGCARTPPAASAPAPEGRVLDARTGRPASWERFIADLLQARVVYVGERHDEVADHRAQASVVRALHRRDPSLALGLEMVQRPFQGPLDAWLAGEITEAELLDRLEWETRWGFDFAWYRPLLSYARSHDLQVVALNAAAETTRAVARRGVAGLDPPRRDALPELDLQDPEHRALVTDALAAHGDLDAEALQRFYQAQVVWDESMAASVAEYLARPEAARRMVVLAGRMHVLAPAIPERAARRGARPHRVVLPVEEHELDEVPPGVDWLWVHPAPGGRGRDV
ncbi:MAG: ChaN family lipoprotein [Myxococcota bacterium]